MSTSHRVFGPALLDADSICDGPPSFTAEEKERLRKYNPPGPVWDFMSFPRKRTGQSGKAAADERQAWLDDWRRKISDLERWG